MVMDQSSTVGTWAGSTFSSNTFIAAAGRRERRAVGEVRTGAVRGAREGVRSMVKVGVV